jgi:hypothetical protein
MTEAKTKGYRHTNAKEIHMSQKEYRNAQCRHRAARKRGHDVPLELFLNNPKVKLHKAKPKAYFHARRALQVSRATPKWVDIEAIAEFYGNCPKGYQVDHIVPINGDNVSGLHVLANLQYLSVADHRVKTNAMLSNP